MSCMQEFFLDIRKLLKSCVCDALGLVSRKEFETQKEIIEKLTERSGRSWTDGHVILYECTALTAELQALC